MNQNVDRVLQEALRLSIEDRASLASSILDSLDACIDEDVEAAWEEEIARRIRDLHSGKAKTYPWLEVRERILAKIDARQNA